MELYFNRGKLICLVRKKSDIYSIGNLEFWNFSFHSCAPLSKSFDWSAELMLFHQDMENAYPGSNILVVTLTNEESKRVEAQSDRETLEEAMGVLRDMFGPKIPDAIDILVPRWWNNRFQRGSYSNYPIISNMQVVHNIQVCLIVFFLIYLDVSSS